MNLPVDWSEMVSLIAVAVALLALQFVFLA